MRITIRNQKKPKSLPSNEKKTAKEPGPKQVHHRATRKTKADQDPKIMGKYCYYCKLQGHCQEECTYQIQENNLCQDVQGRIHWPKVYVMEQRKTKGTATGFSIMSLMAPLIQAPSVIPQMILISERIFETNNLSEFN
jgi:hypothetical protein